jgi:hypothetical protein
VKLAIYYLTGAIRWEEAVFRINELGLSAEKIVQLVQINGGFLVIYKSSEKAHRRDAK